MHRRLFTLASVLSLLISIAALSLWIPSYRWGESIGIYWQTAAGTVINCQLFSGSGSVCVDLLRFRGMPPDNLVKRWEVSQTDESAVVPRNGWERIGFGRFHTEEALFGMTASIDAVGIPHWLVAGVFAILPVQWLWRAGNRRRTRRRAASGACIACGYDLKCNASGICPECGTPIARGSERGA